MAIVDTITSMQTHTSNAYTMIGYGTDLTGINKNLENLSTSIFNAFLEALRNPDTLFTNLPKKSGSGSNITLNNTANAPMRIELNPSELEQETTTGKNKFNGNAVSTTSPTNWGITFENNVLTIEHKTSYTTGSPNVVIGTLQSGNYTISYTSQSKMSLYVDGAYDQILDNGETFTAESNKTYSLYFSVADNSTETFTNVQLESGSTATDYEPYTGGNPAPNPDFPMPIHTISGSNTIKVVGKNLFDKTTSSYGALNRNSGEQGTDTLYKTSDYIIINPTKSYYTNVVLYASDGFGYAFYDKDKTYISGIPSRNIINSIPSNAKYIRISYRVSTSTNTDEDTLYFVEGSTATTYEPYTSQEADIDLGDIEYCKIGDYEDEFYKATNENNLFDKDNANILKLVPSGGSNMKYLNSNTNASIYIPIIGGKTYTISRQVLSNRFSVATSNEAPALNGAIIDITTNNSATSLTLTTSSNANYLCVYLTNDGTNFDNTLDTLMINEGSTTLPYEPYADGKWYIKKNIGKYISTGNENWILSTVSLTNVERFYTEITIPTISNVSSYSLMNRFRYIGGNEDEEHFRWTSNGSIYNRIYIYINKNRLSSLDKTGFKEWLSDNNIELYNILATPTYTLLNDTLQSQLEYIYNQMLAYKGQTNISQVNNDLPFELNVSALEDLE